MKTLNVKIITTVLVYVFCPILLRPKSSDEMLLLLFRISLLTDSMSLSKSLHLWYASG